LLFKTPEMGWEIMSTLMGESEPITGVPNQSLRESRERHVARNLYVCGPAF
jgi:hypothetical protein